MKNLSENKQKNPSQKREGFSFMLSSESYFVIAC